jgi:hypothetical protein
LSAARRRRRWYRAAAADRGDVHRLGQALEAGDDDDAAAVDLFLHALRLDGEDARVAVDGVGAHARLGAGEADRLDAEGVERHDHERAGLRLAGAEEDVHLARVGFGGDLVGVVDELVGGVAHGGDDGDDVIAGIGAALDARGDVLDALGGTDGGAAVLLHDQCHASLRPRAPRKKAPVASVPPAGWPHAVERVRRAVILANWRKRRT